MWNRLPAQHSSMNVRSSSIGAVTTPALFDAHEPHARQPTLDEVGRSVDFHAIAQTVMAQLSGGVFLTGFALALGAKELLIGIIAALPFVMKLSQLYLSWRVEKLGRWRHTAFRGAVLGRAALLLAAFVPVGVASFAGAPFGAIALTVAVKVTDSPKTDGSGEAVRVVVVLPGSTVLDIVPVLPLKPASPL